MSEHPVEYPEYLSDVEKANNYPIIISAYGFKKIQVNGRNYLTARTEAEFIAVYAKDNNITPEEVQDGMRSGLISSCASDGIATCFRPPGCKSCQLMSDSAGHYCMCTWY